MKDIITAHKNKINAIIKRFTGSSNEDLEQEVYIKTWKNLEKYVENNKFSQWISTITANVCKDYLKSKTIRNKQLETSTDEEYLPEVKDLQTPERNLSLKDRQKIILKEIYKLPKKLRDVIILFELEEKSYDEISKKLKVPEGTIKSRLYNARKILSKNLNYLKGEF